MEKAKKPLLQIEDKSNDSPWKELSQLLREHLEEQDKELSQLLREHLEEQDKDNEDLQIHKIRRTKFSTPEGI